MPACSKRNLTEINVSARNTSSTPAMYVSGKYKVRGIKLAGGQVKRNLDCSTSEDERTATLRKQYIAMSHKTRIFKQLHSFEILIVNEEGRAATLLCRTAIHRHSLQMSVEIQGALMTIYISFSLPPWTNRGLSSETGHDEILFPFSQFTIV